MRIKICGLTRAEDIEAVNAYRPDYVGFVFAPSRRRVSAEEAERLKALLRPDIVAVGVFRDETPEAVADLLRRGVMDMAQLHGGETPEYVAQLRRLTGAPVIKAIGLPTPELVGVWEGAADYLLLDSASGGSGQCLDWDSTPIPDTPWFLAGGLDAENLERAARYRPYGLDISSGAETAGRKDPEKIRILIEKARKLP